jgi:hypothetical protein
VVGENGSLAALRMTNLLGEEVASDEWGGKKRKDNAEAQS